MDCIFCKIASGKIPTEFVYENEQLVAFKDLHPKAPHHILIIPRKHIATLDDAADEDTNLLGDLLQTAKKIAQQLNIAKEGYRTLMNCNKAGGQEVFHIHLHLIGGRTMHWPPG